jgi:hypothetical protein
MILTSRELYLARSRDLFCAQKFFFITIKDIPDDFGGNYFMKKFVCRTFILGFHIDHILTHEQFSRQTFLIRDVRDMEFVGVFCCL